MFTLGYNTNGLAHHRLDEALTLIAEMGYGALALTPDVGQLDPYRCTAREVAEIRAQAQDLGIRLVIETGARYLLDPGRKHFPTLLEEDESDRRRRLEFLGRCVDLATDLGAPLVSIWSGAAPGGQVAESGAEGNEPIWDRLCAGLKPLLDHGANHGVEIAFEPEPGMFVERPAGYRELLSRMGIGPSELGLTLDVGHLVVTGDLPVGRVVREHAGEIRNVHLDDCPRGVHEHGLFGTGDLDLQEAVNALLEAGYEGVASVELSRDSHRGPVIAAQALAQLRRALEIGS